MSNSTSGPAPPRFPVEALEQARREGNYTIECAATLFVAAFWFEPYRRYLWSFSLRNDVTQAWRTYEVRKQMPGVGCELWIKEAYPGYDGITYVELKKVPAVWLMEIYERCRLVPCPDIFLEIDCSQQYVCDIIYDLTRAGIVAPGEAQTMFGKLNQLDSFGVDVNRIQDY
ncbi:hypothetical protein FZEAL_8901 [Fusarium zealandicum]|uniref:Uncharacterized protein n=1 Tax=Fusarium zealandicum TaxID=1053134 RepID=A0A8H4UCZ3_9HYPO|nr:hypothetical protein FZEAL_8901 [Fusarium zealandicum]